MPSHFRALHIKVAPVSATQIAASDRTGQLTAQTQGLMVVAHSAAQFWVMVVGATTTARLISGLPPGPCRSADHSSANVCSVFLQKLPSNQLKGCRLRCRKG